MAVKRFGWRGPVAGLMMVMASSGPQAAVPESGVSTLKAAFADLDALARTTRAVGDLPRWSNPDHAKVLARVWDASAILGAPPYGSADIEPLMTIGDAEIAVYKTYAFFSPSPTALPDTARNGGVYQNEIARSGAFLVRLFAAELAAVADFFGKLKPEEVNDVRRRGLQTMRLGMTELVSGAALFLRSPGLRPENRAVLVESFAESGQALADGMTPTDRAAMMAQVDTIMPSLTELERARLGVFRLALAGRSCTGLCSVD